MSKDQNVQIETLKEGQNRCKDYLSQSLKVWSQKGADESYVEALDFDGNPLIDLPRRGRVQGRQLLVYAMSHEKGFDHKGIYLAQAEKLYKTIVRDYALDGKLIFKRSSEDPDTHLFAYEQSFMIMATSYLYRATGKELYKQHADSLWLWLEETLLDPVHDGFQVGAPADQNNPRQQNPHMHLFEACLVCAQNLDKTEWLKRADWLFSLFEKFFWSAPEESLREFFTAEWAPDPQKGDSIEPGHHFEWCWLLGEYAQLSGKDLSDLQGKVFHKAHTLGVNANGFGRDELHISGGERRSTSRLWVQCELLKAYVAQFRVTSDPVYKQQATILVGKIFQSYLHPELGVWFDQLSQDGQNISVHSPASTFYHLFIAFLEYLSLEES